jgi:hypothetical protein
VEDIRKLNLPLSLRYKDDLSEFMKMIFRQQLNFHKIEETEDREKYNDEEVKLAQTQLSDQINRG